MNIHEDDEVYDDFEDIQPKRSKRTKFRDFEGTTAKRDKLSSKRSHRQQTNKDDLWPDNDD